MRKSEIYLLAGTLIGILALGFFVNVGSFGQNLLASAADIIVGIFIAFYLIDRISLRERARKWERVKHLTYRSIESASDLIMFTFRTQTYVGLGMNAETAKPSPSSKQRYLYEHFLQLSEVIRNELDEPLNNQIIVVDPQRFKHSSSSRYSVSEMRGRVTYVPSERDARQIREENLHKHSSSYLLRSVRPDFEKLSFHIFPRIFELDEQEELISSLIEVEAAFQEWESTVDTIEGDWGMPDQFAWDAVAGFCKEMGKLLKVIYLTNDSGGSESRAAH
jgi:hypothetical protein